jgi:predicted hotdog family 3-hydroxylacyl-ACP dehydratase
VRVSRAELAGLLPHAGAMNLLHEVVHHDEDTIHCVAVSHRDLRHPLREAGRLGAVCAIEYAAQAMAVHGALRQARGARAGMLAAVRDVNFEVRTLDDIADDLVIRAHRLASESGRQVYEFAVSAGARALVSGRAIIVEQEHTPQ